MSVDFVRQEVKDRLTEWKLVRDAVAGSKAVKAGGYLTPINSHDTSDENKARNKARVDGAVYFNATGRTLNALIGIAYQKWPGVELPAGLDYLVEDADGSGVGLVNQSQSVMADLLEVGRAGLLVDYPQAEAPASRAQQDAGEIRATIQFYAAESIINWRTVKRGAKNLLGMVVLEETVEVWKDFEREDETQYRVLLLGRLSYEDETAPERYVVQIWKAGESGAFQIAEEYVPLNGRGQPWQEIPFTFIGAVNNDANPDKSPLYDLAELNIAHFRNSADFEESLFFAGQAQLCVIGVDEQWSKMMEESGVYVGSRAILPVPQGGNALMLQAQPVSALSEEMKHKVELMAQLGARLIAPGEATQTATQAASEERAANSVLSLCADNTSAAYTQALLWCAEYMNASGEVEFDMPTEYGGMQFDANQLTAAVAAVQGGLIPEKDFWTYCRNIGLIDATKTDEDIAEAVAAQGPRLGMVGRDDLIGGEGGDKPD